MSKTKLNLTSERLRIRPVALTDMDWIHMFNSIAEVDRYNTLGIPENRGVTDEKILPLIEQYDLPIIEKYTFVIQLLDSAENIGMAGVNLSPAKSQRAELWYKFHPDYWRKGFATEAGKRLLEFGFNQLGLHRIEAGCAIENEGSVKVLEKIGMTREGQKRKTLPLISGWSDNYEYGILKEEFK